MKPKRRIKQRKICGMILEIFFGVVGLGSGITLLGYGFGAYFNILPGSEWSTLMLTYDFLVAVIGMDLKAFFGAFDGRGGVKAAKYAAENLTRTLWQKFRGGS